MGFAIWCAGRPTIFIYSLLSSIAMMALGINLKDAARLDGKLPDVVPDYQDARETNSPSWLPVRAGSSMSSRRVLDNFVTLCRLNVCWETSSPTHTPPAPCFLLVYPSDEMGAFSDLVRILSYTSDRIHRPHDFMFYHSSARPVVGRAALGGRDRRRWVFLCRFS